MSRDYTRRVGVQGLYEKGECPRRVGVQGLYEKGGCPGTIPGWVSMVELYEKGGCPDYMRRVGCCSSSITS